MPKVYAFLRSVKYRINYNKELRDDKLFLKKKLLNYYNSKTKENNSFTTNQEKVLKSIRSNREIELPNKVVIEINNTCNLDCLMCKTSLSTRKKGKMEVDTFKNIIDYCKKNNIFNIELHTIGDPLMSPILDQVLEYLKKKKMFVGLGTNGLLIKKRFSILKKYESTISMLDISIDSPEKETYEILRAKGNFEELLENLEIAKNDLNIKLKVSMTLSKVNRHLIGKFIEFSKNYVENLSKDINFGIIGSLSPDSSFFDQNNIFPEQTYSNRLCGNMVGESLNFHINGDLSICARDYDGSLVIGNINNDNAKNILNNSEKFREIKNRHVNNELTGPCATCKVVEDDIGDILKFIMNVALKKFNKKNYSFFDEMFNLFHKFIEKPSQVHLEKLLKKIEI
ncbi:radical SAM protein [Pelagibacteraceae bacterium]|nr:radical SAM protein [Pelagibacteraceae bacterium]